MYSRKIVRRSEALYFQKTKKKLVRHSVLACRKAVAHLNSLLTDDGEIDKHKRPNGLFPNERDFIRNEIALCRIDFVYWLMRYAFVKNRTTDDLTLFNPYIAQKIVINIWGQLEEAGLAIACIILKARQHGISSLTEMAVAHRVIFKQNVNAIIGSSDPGKSTEMSKMIEICLSHLPWWMLPEQTVGKRGEQIEFGKQNSGISIQHGSQFTGIGRGTTPSTVHLSEVASFLNPAELIDASLMGAFHESSDRFIVLESTAEGNTGYWHDSWENAVETWPRTLLRPIFLPWFIAIDLYPTAAQMRRNPIPLNWEPAKRTSDHRDSAELYASTNPDLIKYLGKDWRMSPEQMYWWECERENYLRKKELNLFLQEYCSNPEEAFQSTNISAFDVDLVSQLRDETRAQSPIAVFSITGGSVSPRLMADNRDIDYKLAKDLTIPITARWNKSVLPVNFELVPLKFRSYQEDPLGRLYVWQLPQKNTRYVIGVDTSDGIGQDRAVIQVIRLRSAFDPYDFDEQCCEFASDNVNSRDLWPLCLAVGTWYTTPSANGKFEQIRQVIECNGNGESVQYELQKLGWWNFHPWEHYDNKRAQQSNKIGWYTNSRTRQMAVDTLISSLRDGWLKIHSPWFVKEMQTFERNEGRQSLRAAFGAHDDRLMPLSFAMCSTYIHEITTDGRSFFAAQRKRQHDIDNQVNGVRPSEQTALLMKELGQQRGTPYSGKYSPY